ncbi:hypothetical protein MMC31_004475 [Peltigera leucophlebia]|nr:hypothetical protein [Peltigera leucophlebia]
MAKGAGPLYRPPVTRLPSLLSLLTLTLSLIALTEYACRRLPARTHEGIVNTLGRKNFGRDLHGRAPEPLESGQATIPLRAPSLPVPATVPATATPALSNNPPLSQPLPAAPTGGGGSNINQFAPPSAYLPVDTAYIPLSSQPPQPSAPQTVFLPLSSAVISTRPPEPAGAPPLPAFLPLSPTVQPLNTPLAAPPSAFLPIAGGDATLPSAQPSVLTLGAPPGGAFLPLSKTAGQTLTNGGVPGQTQANGGVSGQTLANGGVPGQTLANGGVSGKTLANGGVPGQTLANGGVPGQTLANGGVPGATTMPPAQTTGTFQGESYSVGSNGLVVIDGTSFNTATPTTATLRGGKVVVVWPTGSVSIQEAQDRAPSKKIFITPKEYIIGAFVPTILAVIYSIPWHLLASAIQEIEPFYQLQRPEGVSAEDSIALDYRASINVIATFSAITKGHFLVWWSGLISLLVLVLAPVASQTVFIGFIGSCTVTSGRQACSPELSVYPVAARVLQGILAFIAVLTLALAAAIKRGKSGLYANPLSIAGLATLFQNDHVVESFRRLNPYCRSSRMIRASLQGHRFRMTSYVDNDGSSSYGLVMCYEDPATVQTSYETAFRGGKKYASVAVDAVEADERVPLRRQRTVSDFFIHPAAIVGFALFVTGLEALIIYYNNTSGDTGFERFMDSQSFGVGFLFTALGVILKLYWCLLDDEVRNMEPYRQLLAGDVKASDSILLAPHTNPFTGIFYSVRNGHFFNAYVSLVAILCEPLIVALSNIPFKAGLAFIAYRVSTYISIGILSMMLLGILWMLVVRKRTPELVRRPDTIASILLFICGSAMLDDFKGMSQMDRNERDAMVKRWNKRYSMGNVIGLDTVEREGIDESIFVTMTTRL